jgi:hypothetical protein
MAPRHASYTGSRHPARMLGEDAWIGQILPACDELAQAQMWRVTKPRRQGRT